MIVDNLQLFVRLLKVDEAKKTVSGVIANEAVDHAGEVFDYNTSKDYFAKWSEGLRKATNGQSVGNVRAMHGNVCAGKLTEITFDDVNKSISVVAEIVDPVEFEKVMKGCYTGYSIGGSYVRKWDDTAIGKKRYTANPNEVSLVDLPCNPEAVFKIAHADGSEEMRKYVTATESKSDGDAAAKTPAGEATPSVAVTLGKTQVLLNTPTEVRAAWTAFGPREDSPERQTVVKRWVETFGKEPPHMTPTVAVAKFDAVAAGILLKVRAGDEQTMATVEAIRKAVGRPELEKGMYDCAYLCDIFRQLGYAVDNAQFEKEMEGDGSAVPEQLLNVLRDLGKTLIAMVSEETNELVTMYATTEPMIVELADTTGDLAKSTDVPTLQKAVGQLSKDLTVAKDSLKKANTAIGEQNAGLMKLREERDDLKKAVKAKDEEIAKLKKTPAETTSPRASLIKAVSKDGKVDALDPSGTGNEINPIMKKDGSGVDEAATAIKKAHAAGGRPLMGR